MAQALSQPADSLSMRCHTRLEKKGVRSKPSLRTSQAPLTNLSCSNTYMGSVSHRLLVLSTRMPRLSISRQACSIQPTRSPRLLPRAMYAVVGPLGAFAVEDLHPQLPHAARVCWWPGEDIAAVVLAVSLPLPVGIETEVTKLREEEE